jgi:GTP-binding protein
MVEKFSVIKALQAMEAAQVVVVVIDAREGITDQDLHLLGYALDSGRALMIAVNKWDGLEADHKERVRVNLGRRLEFAPWVKIKFISALHGTGVGDLWGMVEQAWDSAFIKIGTNELTRMMEEITNGHPPPRNGRFRAKLRYAHLGGNNPPTLVLHGNRTEALPASYKKFLENRFRELLKLEGTPIRLEFKSGTNPYEGRKNVLTDRQVHKRKRMIKRMKK